MHSWICIFYPERHYKNSEIKNKNNLCLFFTVIKFILHQFIYFELNKLLLEKKIKGNLIGDCLLWEYFFSAYRVRAKSFHLHLNPYSSYFYFVDGPRSVEASDFFSRTYLSGNCYLRRCVLLVLWSKSSCYWNNKSFQNHCIVVNTSSDDTERLFLSILNVYTIHVACKNN